MEQKRFKNTRDKKKDIEEKSKLDPNSFVYERMDNNKSYMGNKSKILN